MHAEAASLLHLIGGMGAKHLLLVGGLVPPLLVTTPTERHVGSADVDLCLSVAFTGGATREYYASIEAKISPFFEPAAGTAFRWRKRRGAPGAPLLVDFLAPEFVEDAVLADGTRELLDKTATSNAGTRLRPLALKAAGAMLADVEETELVVDDVYGPGRLPVNVSHTGPVGLLVAKAEALNGRAEGKDGYDVAWYCLNAAATPREVADLLSARPAFSHELVPEAIALLLKAFAEPDFPGPVGYATLARPDVSTDSDEHHEARNAAHLAVTGMLEILRGRIPWDALGS